MLLWAADRYPHEIFCSLPYSASWKKNEQRKKNKDRKPFINTYCNLVNCVYTERLWGAHKKAKVDKRNLFTQEIRNNKLAKRDKGDEENMHKIKWIGLIQEHGPTPL